MKGPHKMLGAYFFQFPCFSMPPRHWGQCRQGIEVNAAKSLRSMPPRHWGQCRQGIEVNAAKALRSMPPRHWGQCRQGIEVNAAKALRSMPPRHWGQCWQGIKVTADMASRSMSTRHKDQFEIDNCEQSTNKETKFIPLHTDFLHHPQGLTRRVQPTHNPRPLYYYLKSM